MISLEDLLKEMEASGFLLFNLYENGGTWADLHRWNVRLKCPTSGLYAFGTADTPQEAFRIALDSAKEIDQWKPTQALTKMPSSRTLADPPKTLEDVLSFLPKPTESSAS